MKIRRETLLIAFIGAVLGFFPGCGGSTYNKNNNPPPASISVAISSPPTSVTAGQTAQFTATVSNDSANGGVTWSCTPANCGSFSPTKTVSGSATTYTAPSTAGSVMIVATSVTDTTKTATATVTISAAQQGAISIKVSGPTSLAPSATGTFTATVTNDSAGKGVAWTCTPANSCGTFSPQAGTGNSVTTAYTAPATAPSGGNVTIVATSQADGKTTGTATVSIAAAQSLNLGAGTYVFSAVGEDSTKHTVGVAGAITIDGSGNITGGEQDYINEDGVAADNTVEQGTADSIKSGNLAAPGTDGRSTLTINFSRGQTSGSETLAVTIVNSKHAVIGEFDGNATSSGSLDFQTPPATSPYTVANIAGAYSFAVTGRNEGSAYSQGGVFTLAANGDVRNGVTDFNELNGSVTINTLNIPPNKQTTPTVVNYPTGFAPGCASLNAGVAITNCGAAPDQFGRGTGDFGGIFWSYYIVNPEVLRLVGYYPTTTTNTPGTPDQVYIGSAYGQGQTPNFSTASLNGSYVFKDQTVFVPNPNGNADVFFAAAGTLTANAGTISSGFIDVVRTGTAFPATYNNGASLAGATFSVPSPVLGTGGSGILTLPSGSGGLSLVGVYFVDPKLNILDPNNTTSGTGGALIVSLDPTNVGAGVLIPQGTVSGALQGNLAFNNQAFNANGEADVVGQLAISNSNVSGKADSNDLFGTKQVTGAALTGSNFTADTKNAGRYTVAITTSLNNTPTTLTFVLYQIDSSGYLSVETDTAQIGTGTLQAQQ